MDINDYVFGDGVVTPEQQKMLAASLRHRDNMGAIMAASGDRAIAPVGNKYMDTANKGIQQGIQHNYYQGMLRETAKDRDARLKMAADSNRLGMAKIGALERTAALRGQTSEKPMRQDIFKKLTDTKEAAFNLERLETKFNPKWTSPIPGMGPLKRAIAQYAPVLATQDMEDFNDWFGDLDRTVEAGVRSNLFGAAFTATEAEIWKKLTVNPNGNQRQIVKWFERNKDFMKRRLQDTAAMASYNYPTQTARILGMDEGPAQSSRPAPEEDALSYEIVQDEE